VEIKRERPLSPVLAGLRVEAVSFAWMVVEAAIGIGSGLQAHSLSLTAFGMDSLVELVSGAALLWRLGLEARGGKSDAIETVEGRAERIVGWALLVLALYVAITAARELFVPPRVASTPLGITLLAVSGVLMPYLSRRKVRIGKEIGSPALHADGMCSLTCAYMAWTALAGLLLTGISGWGALDALGALALDVFIVREALETLRAGD